jgi:transcriptional regulator with XRE-family HTH domain
MALSDRIREIIKESGLNQKKFAKAIGVTDSFISKILRDETGISNARAQIIEGLYKFSKDWILKGTEPKKKSDFGKTLSPLQLQIINSIEKMDDNELIEVLTYIDTRQKNMEKWGITPGTRYREENILGPYNNDGQMKASLEPVPEQEPDFIGKKRA